jgi:hypothetical protein
MKKTRLSDGMVPIQTLFSKYKDRLVAPQKSVEAIAETVIKETLGLGNYSGKLVSYRVSTKTLHFIGPSLLRNESIKNKHKLLKEITLRLGERSAPIDLI